MSEGKAIIGMRLCSGCCNVPPKKWAGLAPQINSGRIYSARSFPTEASRFQRIASLRQDLPEAGT